MPDFSRRSFLLTAVAGSATVAAMPSAVAVDKSAVFADASRTYGVPVGVLAGISFVQSQWSDHEGRPSRSHGYGPMHLVDGAAVAALRVAEGKPADSTVDSLADAVAASGLSADAIRRDAGTNIKAAAALLAATQRKAGRAVGAATDPAAWYASIAAVSGLGTRAAQVGFADEVLAELRRGMSVKQSGTTFKVAPQKVGSVAAARTGLLNQTWKPSGPRPALDAPRGLGVEWIPAPYEQSGTDPTDYGNHDLAFRPRSPKLTHIVIHDTEGPYDVCIRLVTDPTYLAWNYTLRSADGHIAQHLETKDIGWHAGNWYMNMHSVGLEHEGYAAQGFRWYNDLFYRRSAQLTRYLCQKYDIPMDRHHIIGHDQVPSLTTAGIKGMHWDPGPFWNWERYFELMGAPLTAGTSATAPRVGDVIRILPGFDTNLQTIKGISGHGTNFVYLRTSPSNTAPLVTDPGIKATASTTDVADIGARATAGTDFVVAQVSGDWTAIWFVGAIAWFYNPVKAPKARVVTSGRRVTPIGASASVFGGAYPEPSAFSNPAQAPTFNPLLYTLKAGQQYALVDDTVPTDYYRAKTFSLDTPGDHVTIEGKTKYYQISLGHRVAFVRADQVKVQ